MTPVCQSYVLVCHLHVTHIYSMSFVCQSYVLTCNPYDTTIYSYVIRMSFVCHTYLLAYHLYIKLLLLLFYTKTYRVREMVFKVGVSFNCHISLSNTIAKHCNLTEKEGCIPLKKMKKNFTPRNNAVGLNLHFLKNV